MSYQQAADFLAEEAEYYQARIISDWPSCALNDSDGHGDTDEMEFLALQDHDSGTSPSSATAGSDDTKAISSTSESPSERVTQSQQLQTLARTSPDREDRTRHNVTFQHRQSWSSRKRDDINDFFGPKFGIRRRPTPHPMKMRASLANRRDCKYDVQSRLDVDHPNSAEQEDMDVLQHGHCKHQSDNRSICTDD